MNNSIATALEGALSAREALDSQPQMLEIPSQSFIETRADLDSSSNEEVRFNRVSEMIAQEIAGLPAERTSQSRLSRLRKVLIISAAAMPAQALVPKDGLVEDWRAANARIDVLEDEKQKLQESLADAGDTIERLESLTQMVDRKASMERKVSTLVLCRRPDARPRARFAFDLATMTVSQVPL